MDEPNPRIADLKAIFPDFDDALILSVLDTAGGDHDRAADVLLGMSDPSFTPPAPPPPSALDPYDQRLSQEALDEEFARRLALEERETATREWSRFENSPGYLMYQPYQGRQSSRTRRSQSQSQPGQGGRDTMTEFQEGFTRIAESGKKTFASLVSKVRAKMQEFEHGQGGSGSQLDQNSSLYAPPQLNSVQARASPPADPSQPSYYDPNSRGYDLYADDEATLHTPSPLAIVPPASALSQAAAPTRAEEAVDALLVERGSPVPPLTLDPETRASPSPPPTTNPGRPSLSSITTKGTGAGRSAPVDFSKLGLLPKRPISLVRPLSPPVGAGTGAEAGVDAPRIAVSHSDSSTDSSTHREDPEFIENPFEDHAQQ